MMILDSGDDSDDDASRLHSWLIIIFCQSWLIIIFCQSW